MRPNRRAENGSGVIGKGQRVPSPPVRRSGGKVSSPSRLLLVGSGADPRKILIFEHFRMSKISLSDNVLLDAATVDAGAGKLSSICQHGLSTSGQKMW